MNQALRVGIILGLSLCVGCAMRTITPKAGDIGALEEDCIAFASLGEVADLVTEGRSTDKAISLPAKTKVKAIDQAQIGKTNPTKVEVLDGPHQGKFFWAVRGSLPQKPAPKTEVKPMVANRAKRLLFKDQFESVELIEVEHPSPLIEASAVASGATSIPEEFKNKTGATVVLLVTNTGNHPYTHVCVPYQIQAKDGKNYDPFGFSTEPMHLQPEESKRLAYVYLIPKRYKTSDLSINLHRVWDPPLLVSLNQSKGN